METNTKKIIGTLALIAAVGGSFYLVKKGKNLYAGTKMNFALLGFRIHKLTLQEAEFAVKLRCYNPTSSPITLAVNQVTANYKDSAIAYSNPDITGLTIPAGGTQEPEIHFQVPFLNLIGKGVTTALLQNTEQLKAGMSFTLTVSINGETLTTTQSLADESQTAGLGSQNNGENKNSMKQNRNIPASSELGIVSGPRNTRNGKRFNSLIQKAQGKETLIKNGNVIETVESCIDIVADHYREVEKLAELLQADSLKATCRNIFNFTYSYLQYNKDQDGTEQLRTPARSWADGQIKFKQKGDSEAGIDCDDYSIFVGSLLKCLGIPFKLRITKYDGKKNFQHIYIFVPAAGDSEDEIIIDPVLSKFDYQKPYTTEKSDFDMSPLQMIGGIRGIDGITGTTSLGLPIYALSGTDLAGGRQAQESHTELMAIVSGIDFEDTVNGLGDPEDATLKYLIRTRDFLLKNKNNKNKMAHIQNPDQFTAMLDQAVKYWNTPRRDAVLTKLADIEEKLAEKGLVKYDADTIEGFEENDSPLDETAGLGRNNKKKKGRFFKAIKTAGKKVGKVSKKAVKAAIRFNPLSVAVRGGLLAALRLNMFGMSATLQYAYLPDESASKYNIEPDKLKDLKKRHAKVKKLFKGLQGKEENLRKAILKGAKQKSPDFSLKGMNSISAGIQELHTRGELSEFGNLGVAATAASVSAASGVIAKITSWLKPVKSTFSKLRGKAAVNKIEKKLKKGKEIKENLKTRAAEYRQSQTQATNSTDSQNNTVNTVNTVAAQQTSSVSTNSKNTKKGLSKKAKAGIAVGALALIGTGTYLLFRKKNSKAKQQSKPEKKTLGKIEFS